MSLSRASSVTGLKWSSLTRLEPVANQLVSRPLCRWVMGSCEESVSQYNSGAIMAGRLHELPQPLPLRLEEKQVLALLWGQPGEDVADAAVG